MAIGMLYPFRSSLFAMRRKVGGASKMKRRLEYRPAVKSINQFEKPLHEAKPIKRSRETAHQDAKMPPQRPAIR